MVHSVFLFFSFWNTGYFLHESYHTFIILYFVCLLTPQVCLLMDSQHVAQCLAHSGHSRWMKEGQMNGWMDDGGMGDESMD